MKKVECDDDCFNCKYDDCIKVQRNSEYYREYYKKNKEKMIQSQKKYNEKNKEKLAEYRKEYYKKNKEKILEHQKEYKKRKKEAKNENTSNE